jgi:hypothetical protein
LSSAGVKLDRAFVQRDRAPKLAPAVTREQIPVLVEHPRLFSLDECLLVQRLRRKKIALLTQRLIPLQKCVLLHG